MPVSRNQLDRSLELLHVSDNSSWDDVQTKYRQLVQKCHPDRFEGNHHEDAHAKFLEITGAFKILREHYQQLGSVPVHSSAKRELPLNSSIRTNSQSKVRPNWSRTTLFAAAVLLIISTAMWSLDRWQIEQNRERAHSESGSSPF